MQKERNSLRKWPGSVGAPVQRPTAPSAGPGVDFIPGAAGCTCLSRGQVST